MLHKHLSPIFFIALALVISLSGCASKQEEAQAPKQELKPIRSIVVLPVEVVSYDKIKSTDEKTKAQLDEGKLALDKLLNQYFAGYENITIITENQRDALDNNFARCRTTAAITICKKYDADAVLLFTLHRFRERDGNEYSVVKPASVAFDYKLITAATGQTLCAGVYNETQKPLLDDMFKFFKRSKRGLKWITAEALAREGVIEKLESCPYLKKD